MYYTNGHPGSMSGFADQLKAMFGAVSQLPQTQRDINEIARTSSQLRSPEVQNTLMKIQSDAQSFARIQLSLQVFSTMASIGLFMLALSRHSKGGK